MKDQERLASEIPSLQGCRLTPIVKGFSGDTLFRVESESGGARLLRLFGLHETGRKREEFGILREMEQLGVKSPRPLELGDRSTYGYMIVSWIEGKDAEEALSALPPAEQYRIGLEAGMELRTMHRLPAPRNLPTWYDGKAAKHARYAEQYEKCGIRVKGDRRTLAFIDRNLPLMKQRPSGFQHDDFHPANLITADGHLAGVIDFNRFDWGDPLHDFLKLGLFGREVSVPFCIGQVRGYFGMTGPDERFWRLYALYVAMSVISTVVWTLRAAPDMMDRMMERIERVLEDHEGFERDRPLWYREDWFR
jgi:aminoglycoside phosphotransferase (APT) family kinase protein